MKKKILLFFITLFVVSCEDNPLESFSGKASEEFQKWKSLGITSYTITQKRLANFSGSEDYVKIYVRNNTITDIRDTSGTASIASDKWIWYKSVNQLFEILIDVKNTRPSSYEVLYDNTYHYPAILSLGPGTAKSSEAYNIISAELIPDK
ncbi:MAG: DUF6174 domain-containing protein [Bacteroidota bacterium]